MNEDVAAAVESVEAAPEAAPEVEAPAVEAAPEAAPTADARIAELEQQIASLLEAKVASDQAAEAAKLESMTEAEKLEALKVSLEERESGLRERARSNALKRLGVLDKYHSYAPQVDVENAREAAKLEAWVKDNPELLKPVAHTKEPSLLDQIKKPSNRLSDILTGKVKSSLVSAESVAEMLGKRPA